ncbi:MAG: alpha/beta hydrolase family protein [Aureispira sp.]
MKTNVMVYCLAGLGLDSNIFKRLNLSVAKEVRYIEWLSPERKESLSSYVNRMAEGISATSDPLVLIGHSFGGIIMQEISKQLPTAHVILISSVKAKKEKNMGMNVFMRAFPLHRMVTQKMVSNSFKSWGKHHGYDSPEAQEIFLQASAKHSNYYFRWATSMICAWKSEGVTTPITHLHGTKDKTFPFRRALSPVIAIENGTHFMVFNKAVLLSSLINKTLKQVNKEQLTSS